MGSHYLINTKTPFLPFINHYSSSVAHSHFVLLISCYSNMKRCSSRTGVHVHQFSFNRCSQWSLTCIVLNTLQEAMKNAKELIEEEERDRKKAEKRRAKKKV